MNNIRKVKVALNNPSIQRINEKCINCGMCFKTCEEVVGLDHSKEGNTPLCINCGQCIMSCPQGALVCKYNYKKVLNLVKDTNKLVAISIAPAIRTSIGEELGFGLGESLENILPSILRSIGFTYVFDVTFGADVTVMEEANELVKRLKNKETLPLMSSCCPSWVKYAKLFHPELLKNLSTVKSPIGIQSTLIKTYFKELNGIEEDIISVVVAPCTAKKDEIINTDTDYVITTRELVYMIKECKIDIGSLKPSDFDKMLSKGSKAGTIFGRSGGVSEAVLGTAYHLITGAKPKLGMFYLNAEEEILEKSFKMGEYIIRVAVVSGLPNLEKILDRLDEFDFIEVMNCRGGCISGGGQPLGSRPFAKDRIIFRSCGLNNIDNSIINSYENKEICELYSSYLGHPLSEKSISLLHTKHNKIINRFK